MRIEKMRYTDWEHSITEKIDSYKACDDFPRPEDFGTTENEVKDYVYDKQRILDRGEERSRNLVIPGIILVMPVIILSGFGEGVKILLIGVLLGVIFTMLYFAIAKAIDKRRLNKMYDGDAERYIQAVSDYVVK